jgi:hypothetical protein
MINYLIISGAYFVLFFVYFFIFFYRDHKYHPCPTTSLKKDLVVALVLSFLFSIFWPLTLLLFIALALATFSISFLERRAKKALAKDRKKWQRK